MNEKTAKRVLNRVAGRLDVRRVPSSQELFDDPTISMMRMHPPPPFLERQVWRKGSSRALPAIPRYRLRLHYDEDEYRNGAGWAHRICGVSGAASSVSSSRVPPPASSTGAGGGGGGGGGRGDSKKTDSHQHPQPPPQHQLKRQKKSSETSLHEEEENANARSSSSRSRTAPTSSHGGGVQGGRTPKQDRDVPGTSGSHFPSPKSQTPETAKKASSLPSKGGDRRELSSSPGAGGGRLPLGENQRHDRKNEPKAGGPHNGHSATSSRAGPPPSSSSSSPYQKKSSSSSSGSTSNRLRTSAIRIEVKNARNH